MDLFEYAVIKNEKRDADGNVTDAAAVLVQPTSVLVENQEQAEIMAARDIPEAEIGNMDRISILVRPFVD